MQMFKFILYAIIIALVMEPPIIAQNIVQKELIFGLKGGVNISAFTTEQTEFNTLFTAGVCTDYYVYNDLGFSLEFNYIQRGGILRQIVPRPSDANPYVTNFYALDLYVKNNYLEFPILFKYRKFIKSDLILTPAIGISYSVPLPFQESSQIKNKKVVESNTVPTFTGQYSDDTAKHNSIFGINLGASLTINKFIMELRYFRSFNEIEGAETIEKLKYKVHSVQFLVGYSI